MTGCRKQAEHLADAKRFFSSSARLALKFGQSSDGSYITHNVPCGWVEFEDGCVVTQELAEALP